MIEFEENNEFQNIKNFHLFTLYKKPETFSTNLIPSPKRQLKTPKSMIKEPNIF
jgi:hypothetical protein